MSNLLKLLFALFLGLVAAGANWFWVSSKANPPTFVAANSTIKAGRKINEGDLISVPVPGDATELKKVLIPYKNRAILFGARASRAYEIGDIFFQRDIQPPAEKSQWQLIGPFRIVSVGARFKEPDDATMAFANDSSRNNVTIEVDANFDEKTRSLLEMIMPDPDAKSEAQSKRIALMVVPKESVTTIEPPANPVYQTISLDKIANVPRVLMAGGLIHFVIPASTEY